MKRRAPASGVQDRSALYVGDIPDHWRAEDVQEMHSGVGLGGGGLAEVKIMPKRLPGETTCAILRYTDAPSAARALEVINGVPVETSSGQQKAIRARFADAQPQQKAPRMPHPGEQAAAPAMSLMPMLPGGWAGPGAQAPAQPRAPGRAGAPPQHSTSVYLSEVPAEFTEQQVHAFHSSLGLGALAGVKFLPRKIAGPTGSVLLRYSAPAAAQQAVLRLNGHPVNLSTGAVKYLTAKLADPPQGGPVGELPVPVPAAPATPRQPGGKAPPPAPEAPPIGCDPCTLYLADVPMNLDAGGMSRLHAESGLDPPSSSKHLPQKLNGETCCVILRYDHEESARRAVQALHSLPVKTPSGKQKFITARYASIKKEDGLEPTYGGGNGHWVAPSDSRRRRSDLYAPGTGVDEEVLPSAYISDLPGEISEDGIRQLLMEVGLDPSLLIRAKFLPRKIKANSLCAILRCADMGGVNDIVNALNGYQVWLPGGQTRNLIARVAEPPKSAGGVAPVASAAVEEPTDLYLSEVPVEWTEEAIIGMHTEVGGDPAALTGVKVLERRHASYPTGAAILRFVDHVSAAAAMAMLQNQPVNIPGGQRRLTVRFADPPKKAKNGRR